MPTYINPKVAYVEPRSGNPVAALVILAVIGYATWQEVKRLLL